MEIGEIQGRMLKKLGIMDSGYGGLSVVADILLHSNEVSIFYFADFLNSPYGDLSKDTVRRHVKTVVEYLLEMEVDGVLLACNTATSVAVDYLRSQFTRPIFGMEPAIKPAILNSEGGKVLVLATSLTLKEDRYLSLKNRIDPMDRTLAVPCPGLASLIDHNRICEAIQYIEDILNHPCHREIHSVVLGCTHYVLLEDLLKERFSTYNFFHGNAGTVRHVLKSLGLAYSDDSIGKRELESLVESVLLITNKENPEFIRDGRRWILHRIQQSRAGCIHAK